MSITRRIFLRRSAAASVALATVTTPVLAGTEQREHPDLLRALEQLGDAVKEFQSAAAAVDRSRAIYNATVPDVPEELILKGPMGRGLANEEVDCEGKIVWRGDPLQNRRFIYSSRLIEMFHGRYFNDGSAASRRFKRLHDLALKHEAGIASAEEVSGIKQAIGRRDLAVGRLQRLATDVTEITPHSLTGVVIKARVLEAYAQCGGEERIWSQSCARQFPADILAVFGSEVRS